MRYVKKIESNVKCGCNVELGPRTVIVGGSGKGKSTIVNAIELAGSGRASDIAGRVTLAKDGDLATLIRTGDVAGFATAVLDDDSRISWMLTPGTRAGRSGADIAFPLREVRENLTGSVETARTWLLGHVARGVDWAAALAAAPTALHERITTLAAGSVLGLPTALSTAKAKAREATKKAETLRESAKAGAGALPPPMTEAEIAAARETAAGEINAQITALMAEATAVIAKRNAAKTNATVAAETFKTLPQPSTVVADVGAAMLKVLDGQIAAKAGKCGICGGDTSVEASTKRRGTVAAAIKAATDAVSAYNAAAGRARQAQIDLDGVQATATRIADDLERLEKLRDSLPEPAAVGERKARWAEIQRQNDAALAEDRTAAEWSELASAVEGIVARVVDGARVAFEARVQACMPAGMRFGIDFTDTTVRFGLRTGPDGNEGPAQPALSGAQWAIVTTALAAAVAPTAGPVVIVPEDRPFDPATLTEALRAFAHAPGQVIVTSPVMPSEVPEGWTVVVVGGPLAQSAALPAVTAQGAVAAPEPKRGRGRPRKARPDAPTEKPSGSGEAPRTTATMSTPNGSDHSIDSLFDDPKPTEFEPAAATKPCPSCGVDTNIEGVMHSKNCTANAGEITPPAAEVNVADLWS